MTDPAPPAECEACPWPTPLPKNQLSHEYWLHEEVARLTRERDALAGAERLQRERAEKAEGERDEARKRIAYASEYNGFSERDFRAWKARRALEGREGT